MRWFLLLAVVELPFFSVVASAESFSQFLNSEIKAQRFDNPNFSNDSSTIESAEASFSADYPNLSTMYLTALKSRSLPTEKVVWKIQRLPRALYLPFGQPTNPFSNTHLIWAFQDQRPLAVFRPVDTTTGCNTGCTPVVFHIMANPNGEKLELIEDHSQPLRKLGHEVFSDADKSKIERHLKRLPEAMGSLGLPTLTTDNATAFPPQTWTALEDVLVKGGAYTTFRIYQASLGLSSFLNKEPSVVAVLQEEQQILGDALSIADPAEAQAFISKLEKITDSNSSILVKAYSYQLISKVFLWYVKNSPATTTKKVFLSHFTNKRYGKERIGYFCSLMSDFLDNADSASFLLALSETDRKLTPRCESNFEKFLPGLALVLAKADATKIANYSWDVNSIPPFVAAKAQLLSAYAEAARISSNKNAARNLVIEFKTRFPQASPLSTEQAALLKTITTAELKKANDNYQHELSRTFVPSEESLPTFKAQGLTGIPKNFPVTGSAKAYVFFSSWCPHCRQTISDWVKLKASSAFWQKVQLIEVSSSDSKAIKEFCQITKLESKQCANIYRVTGEQLPALTKSLKLAGVPRIVITNSKGKVLNFDVTLNSNEGASPTRDLEGMLNEAQKF